MSKKVVTKSLRVNKKLDKWLDVASKESKTTVSSYLEKLIENDYKEKKGLRPDIISGISDDPASLIDAGFTYEEIKALKEGQEDFRNGKVVDITKHLESDESFKAYVDSLSNKQG